MTFDIFDVIGYGTKAKVEIDIPNQEFGKWAIDTMTVTKEQEESQKLRAVINHHSRYVPEGEYKALWRTPKSGLSTPVMTNTPNEILDHYDFVEVAKGNVLINGLGLGVVLEMLMIKNKLTHNIESITFVEIDQDIIDNVGKHYLEKYPEMKLNFICANALEHKPAKDIKYDAVWHDIWDHICEDNLPEMHKLTRRYGRITEWQGSWCREECENLRKGRRGF